MTVRSLLRLAAPLALAAAGSAAAPAGDLHFHGPVRELSLAGELPAPPRFATERLGEHLRPRVELEGTGEAYLVGPGERRPVRFDLDLRDALVAVRAPQGELVRGFLVAPTVDGALVRVPFELDAARLVDGDEAQRAFLWAQAEHFAALRASGATGAGWFRHREREARAGLGEDGSRWEGATRARGRDDTELQRTYALFTGGRAVAENLALDRELLPRDGDAAQVPLDSIRGVEVRAFDWAPLLEGVEVEPEPLAALVPADQHALFLPSLAAAQRLLGALGAGGIPVVELFEARATEADLVERYQRQLCLDLDVALVELPDGAVRSLALTGGDPYFRTGTDVALLLASGAPEQVAGWVRARQGSAMRWHRDAEARSGEAGGRPWRGVETPDRRVSSFVAVLDDAVVVSNSLPQLERVLATAAGEQPALAGEPEYRFFRHRYPRGDAAESALLVLSDATIRRWCGPRWRIGASRRLRAAALLAQAQARHAERVLAFDGAPADLPADALPRGLQGAQLGAGGVDAAEWNTLDFVTPVGELRLEQVTAAERDAYERFRQGYESGWQVAFDPIAVRLELADDRLAADVTVMPLIAGSDYAQLRDLAGDARLDGRAPSPGDALASLAVAIDPKARMLRGASGMARSFGADLGADPLAWLSGAFVLSVERDPFWSELAAAVARGEEDVVLEDGLPRIPLLLRIGVRDPLRLAAFLTALRAFGDQAAPGLTVWEKREHAGRPYVSVLPSEEARAMTQGEEWGLHYAALPDVLVLALREDLLRRALERRADEPPPGERPLGRIGEQLELHLDAGMIDLIAAFGREELRRRLRDAAWSNIPVLDALRGAFPGRDPAQVHEQLFGTRPVDPLGGAYAWDAEWRTHASSTFGHPAKPREVPASELPPLRAASAAFGLTFEHDGLRARAAIVPHAR